MQQLFEQFGINYKLIIAQAVNFGILFFVLKKFAYQPILDLLEARRQKIAESIDMHSKAQHELNDAQNKKNELLKQGSVKVNEIIAQAKARAEDIESEAVSKSQNEASKILSQAKVETEKDRAQMLESLYSESSLIIKDSLRKILATSDLSMINEKIIDDTVKSLKSNSNRTND